MDDQYFVRTFEIDALNTSLKLYQKCEGDVGCVVWDASIVLAKYLEEIYKKNSKQFQNLTVVELGSGAGCVGLTAACFGAKVLLTDLSSVMPLLKKNLEANYEAIKKHNGEAHAEVLEWGKIIHSPLQPVLILIADCVYYKESIDKIIETLKQLAGSLTTIYMSHEVRESEEQRHCWKYFIETIEKFFAYRIVPLEDQNKEFRSNDIILLEFKLI